MRKKYQEHTTLATDVIRHIKKQLLMCQMALAISLAGNVLLAVMLIFR